MSETNVQNSVHTDDGEVTRDSSLNLANLVKKVEPVEKTEASPLEAAMAHQEKGMVVNTDDLKEEETQLRPNYDTEESRAGFDDKVQELEEDATKMKAVYVIKKPENEKETAEMMDEVSAVTFDENGKAIVPEGARYIIPKDAVKGNGEVTRLVNQDQGDESETTTEPVTESKANNDEDDEKNKIIEILIDKTGLGANIELGENEQKVVSESTEIRIVEVEDMELKTARVKKDEDIDLSFMKTIDKYQSSVSKTKMFFPLSGFSAELTGLSYGEFADITLDQSEDSDDEYNFNKVWKMLTVIYNKMINVSGGKFKNFTEFLHKFAWKDVPLATYALLISTQPEVDTLSLRCHADECGKAFEHKYSTRGLIDFDDCSKGYLKLIDKISNAKGNERFTVAEESLVRTNKVIKLPDGKYQVEIGPASCYDYLYGICDQIKSLQDMEDSELATKKLFYFMMLGIVRGIRVQDNSGEWRSITSYDKIVEIFDEYMSPNDFRIIQEIYMKSEEEYRIGFSIKDITCPHCGTVTKAIEVEPKSLVFQIQQTMLNTRLTLDNLQLF